MIRFCSRAVRPVLFIPWIEKEFKAFKRVIVAWDGSRGATRSVFDALPLLEKATDIEIFCVDPRERDGQPGDMAGAEIAASLARHGLNVTTRAQAKENLSISAVLEKPLQRFRRRPARNGGLWHLAHHGTHLRRGHPCALGIDDRAGADVALAGSRPHRCG